MRPKLNDTLVDCGLHTLNLPPKDGEWDMTYVTRWLGAFTKGLHGRTRHRFRQFYFTWNEEGGYVMAWGTKRKVVGGTRKR